MIHTIILVVNRAQMCYSLKLFVTSLFLKILPWYIIEQRNGTWHPFPLGLDDYMFQLGIEKTVTWMNQSLTVGVSMVMHTRRRQGSPRM